MNALDNQRRLAAQVRMSIKAGMLCAKCHEIPDDCTCPAKIGTTTADPLRGTAWWDQRHELRAIYDYARQRGASPAAVLNVTMMMALARTPSGVHLPAVTGGRRGSLNTFGALVGRSGAGKGVATDAAKDGIVFHGGESYVEGTAGSGEGLVGKLAHVEIDRETKARQLERDADSVLLDVAEISGLGAQISRAGSTLGDQLLKAYSGERLGFGYAGANGFEIERHSYRMAMVAGVQPAKSHILLDESGSGLPQRFVWAMATAPDAPDFDPDAFDPDPVHINLPHWEAGEYRLGADRAVIQEVGQNRVLLARGSGDALDGHAMFTRFKVTAALAILRGSKYITVDDWEMSEALMLHSDLARQHCLNVLEAVKSEGNRQRGKDRDEVEVAADSRRRERIRTRLVDAWRDHPQASHSELMKTLAGRDRKDGTAAEIAERLAWEHPGFPQAA